LRFSESGSRFAAYSMAEPDHQTRLSGKRLSEFGLAICVLVDLVDRLTAPTCARGGVSSVLSGRSRIDLNQRDIRRIAQRGCGRRLSLPWPTMGKCAVTERFLFVPADITPPGRPFAATPGGATCVILALLGNASVVAKGGGSIFTDCALAARGGMESLERLRFWSTSTARRVRRRNEWAALTRSPFNTHETEVNLCASTTKGLGK
jgi:hypothetical protein